MANARLDVTVKLTNTAGVPVPNCRVQIYAYRKQFKHNRLLASRLTGSYGVASQGVASFYIPTGLRIAICAEMPGVRGELELNPFDGVPTPPSTTIQSQTLLLNIPSATLGTRVDVQVHVGTSPNYVIDSLVTLKKNGVVQDQDTVSSATIPLTFLASAPNWYEVIAQQPGQQPVTQNIYVQDDGAEVYF